MDEVLKRLAKMEFENHDLKKDSRQCVMASTPKDNNSKLNANKSSNNGCKTISSNNFINIVPTLMWLLNTPLTIK